MRDSQQEIKSTVTVNTSDIAAKAHEDKEVKDLDKISRKKSEKKSLFEDERLINFSRSSQWNCDN